MSARAIALICLGVFAGGGYAGTGTGVPGELGAPYAWQRSVNSVNTANGNRLTAIPLVSWVQRGGLPVAFTLFHNSRSTSRSRPHRSMLVGER